MAELNKTAPVVAAPRPFTAGPSTTRKDRAHGSAFLFAPTAAARRATEPFAWCGPPPCEGSAVRLAKQRHGSLTATAVPVEPSLPELMNAARRRRSLWARERLLWRHECEGREQLRRGELWALQQECRVALLRAFFAVIQGPTRRHASGLVARHRLLGDLQAAMHRVLHTWFTTRADLMAEQREARAVAQQWERNHAAIVDRAYSVLGRLVMRGVTRRRLAALRGGRIRDAHERALAGVIDRLLTRQTVRYDSRAHRQLWALTFAASDGLLRNEAEQRLLVVSRMMIDVYEEQLQRFVLDGPTPGLSFATMLRHYPRRAQLFTDAIEAEEADARRRILTDRVLGWLEADSARRLRLLSLRRTQIEEGLRRQAMLADFDRCAFWTVGHARGGARLHRWWARVVDRRRSLATQVLQRVGRAGVARRNLGPVIIARQESDARAALAVVEACECKVAIGLLGERTLHAHHETTKRYYGSALETAAYVNLAAEALVAQYELTTVEAVAATEAAMRADGQASLEAASAAVIARIGRGFVLRHNAGGHWVLAVGEAALREESEARAAAELESVVAGWPAALEATALSLFARAAAWQDVQMAEAAGRRQIALASQAAPDALRCLRRFGAGATARMRAGRRWRRHVHTRRIEQNVEEEERREGLEELEEEGWAMLRRKFHTDKQWIAEALAARLIDDEAALRDETEKVRQRWADLLRVELDFAIRVASTPVPIDAAVTAFLHVVMDDEETDRAALDLLWWQRREVLQLQCLEALHRDAVHERQLRKAEPFDEVARALCLEAWTELVDNYPGLETAARRMLKGERLSEATVLWCQWERLALEATAEKVPEHLASEYVAHPGFAVLKRAHDQITLRLGAEFDAEARAAEEALAAAREAEAVAQAAEEARVVEEARLAAETRAAEEARLAQEAQAAEDARLAEARAAEEARALAEEARLADEACIADEARAAAAAASGEAAPETNEGLEDGARGETEGASEKHSRTPSGRSSPQSSRPRSPTATPTSGTSPSRAPSSTATPRSPPSSPTPAGSLEATTPATSHPTSPQPSHVPRRGSLDDTTAGDTTTATPRQPPSPSPERRGSATPLPSVTEQTDQHSVASPPSSRASSRSTARSTSPDPAAVEALESLEREARAEVAHEAEWTVAEAELEAAHDRGMRDLLEERTADYGYTRLEMEHETVQTMLELEGASDDDVVGGGETGGEVRLGETAFPPFDPTLGPDVVVESPALCEEVEGYFRKVGGKLRRQELHLIALDFVATTGCIELELEYYCGPSAQKLGQAYREIRRLKKQMAGPGRPSSGGQGGLGLGRPTSASLSSPPPASASSSRPMSGQASRPPSGGSRPVSSSSSGPRVVSLAPGTGASRRSSSSVSPPDENPRPTLGRPRRRTGSGM